MNNGKILSLDGSGSPSYKHPSTEFCIAGIVIEEKDKDKLEKQLNKIKSKFFKDDNIVLHYREISRKIGPFKVLLDKVTEDYFWSDILSILNSPQVICLFAIVDKSKARKKGWQEKTIVLKCYSTVIKMFVAVLKKQKKKGKIITESDKFQDELLIKAHNLCQVLGVPSAKVLPRKYNEMITSLSLVNKNNFDPEIQLVDLLGPTARLKYRLDKLKSKEPISKVEEKKLRLFKRKLKSNSASIKIVV